MHIRKNDEVMIIRGPYKGRRGRVLQVLPKENRLLVEGINMMKRHTKATSRAQQGGIVEREAKLHISNVAAWCEADKKPSKIVMKQLDDGTRVRIWKCNGQTLD